MDYGIAISATDKSIRPDDLARLAEARGFESISFAEHTHIPASERPLLANGTDMPEYYIRTFDPFIALTAAAMVTTRIKLWTGVCLIAQHDPITLAKQVASLDYLSNGRFMFGIGGGWNVGETENHGTPFRRRFPVLRERMLAMRELWENDAAEFHGKYVDFDPIWSYPKPVQKPHPPIFMGGDGPTTFDRVIEFCDGWIPGSAAANLDSSPNLGDKIATLRHKAEDARRDPDSIAVTMFGAKPERAFLDTIESMGVSRAIFVVPAQPQDVVEPFLDDLTKLMR